MLKQQRQMLRPVSEIYKAVKGTEKREHRTSFLLYMQRDVISQMHYLLDEYRRVNATIKTSEKIMSSYSGLLGQHRSFRYPDHLREGSVKQLCQMKDI